jgi:hypothetical protein
MRGLRRGFALLVLAGVWVPISTAWAQSPVGTDACATYLDATAPAQQAVYAAYLQGFANATSPDPRYPPTETTVAEAAKKIHDWCGRNVKSTFGDAVYAMLGAEIRSNQAAVAAAAAADAAQAAPAPPVQIVSQPVLPSSCRVAATNYCGGCSIRCNGNSQATCKPGSDDVFGRPKCDTQAKCDCE